MTELSFDLDELERICERATPPEMLWKSTSERMLPADAEFYVRARTVLPELLRLVKAMQAIAILTRKAMKKRSEGFDPAVHFLEDACDLLGIDTTEGK